MLNQEGFTHLESRTENIDGHRFTPLLCAVKGNAIKAFNFLVSNGADSSARDMNGNGIVEVAVIFGSVKLFEHLLNDKLVTECGIKLHCDLVLIQLNKLNYLNYLNYLYKLS